MALYAIVIFLFAVHIILSFYLKDFTWLAAFGALLTVFGLLSSFSYALPLEEINKKDLKPTIEGEHYLIGRAPMAGVITDKKSIDKIKQSNINSVLKKYENISTYIIFTVLGTLIWAYSSFLNALFGSTCS